MKKAVVTGATGGLGRNLVKRLLDEGWQVAACGRNAGIGKTLGTEFRAFDLADREQTLNAFSPADAVFHCAALSSPWGRYQDFYRANVAATQNVLAAVRRHGAGRLVHVSTPSIYFDYADRRNVPETFVSRRFANHYAYTKFLAEQEVAAAADVPSVIIRPRGIFGEHDTALLPRLLKIAQKGFLPLIRRAGREAGGAVADVTYVGNVVHALVLAAGADVPRAMPFNITNGEPQTVAALYRRIIDALHLECSLKTVPYFLIDGLARMLEARAAWSRTAAEPLMTRYSIGTVAFDQTLDITRARTLLGYEPQTSIADGLRQYARSLKG